MAICMHSRIAQKIATLPLAMTRVCSFWLLSKCRSCLAPFFYVTLQFTGNIQNKHSADTLWRRRFFKNRGKLARCDGYKASRTSCAAPAQVPVVA